MKKRFASVLALVAALAAMGANTASANDTNVGVQLANIEQLSSASSFASQFAGSGINTNVANASSANYAAIVQLLSQSN